MTSSIRVGNPHNNNYAVLTGTLPNVATGVLITAWVRQPTPPAYPYSFGNRYPFDFYSSNWNVLCVSGNMVVNNTSAVDAAWNQNVTPSGGTGDRGGIITDRIAEAQLIGWIFIAWQIIANSTDGIIIRQWAKFGAVSPYISTESQITVAAYRTASGNGTWTPNALTDIYMGGGQAGDVEDYNITRIKLYERGTKPTEKELTAISILNESADTSAWADYPFQWISGAPVLTDRSGNSRPTLTQLGTLTEGLDDATMPLSAQIVAVQSPTEVYKAGSSADLVASFESLPTAGNLLVVAGGTNSNTGTITVTDNQGGSWTVVQGNPTNNTHPFISYCVAPSSSGTYTVTAGTTGSDKGRIKLTEYQGSDSTPFDWSVNPGTLAQPLTLTAGSADARNGELVISSMVPNGGFNDVPVRPADWVSLGANNISGDTSNLPAVLFDGAGLVAQRIFPTAATETITWPAQVGTPTMAGVMLGFKAAATGGGSLGTIAWLKA
jgi:hypothetical protein